MNKVKERSSDLPAPLIIVLLLNAVVALGAIVQTLTFLNTAPVSTLVENGFNILLSALIIIGIIQASRFIRIIVLIFSWITVIMIGIGVVLLFVDGVFVSQVIWTIIPLAFGIVNIWGLCTRKSKIYFGY